ncbi:ADP-ribose pyrophosphatase YjhB, NUDIX family [Terribacillus halophilus]|uniref:ADP-ribose pyrophosphatase YjhB, NUDIX family n=1 Tax=Terribacillus halophilus TaxID=361279 RepID=A0A1G6RSS2_9BACI|nr:NUDIX hydrolase [Terribacillus halophilus]SDD07005.1 ADP-ribose pyrophosphatase YjhB, NUDIX family [Terribacillus halophilus]
MIHYHHAFGVYAVIQKDGNLLVIHKSRGPYTNRYDLPGGSPENGEGLLEAVIREVKEETGLIAEVTKQIGVVDFKLPWQWKHFTDVHHTAVFYTGEVTGTLEVPKQFAGQDALAAEWVPIEKLFSKNSSPLVMQAIKWQSSFEMPLETVVYPDWEIRKKSYLQGDRSIR